MEVNADDVNKVSTRFIRYDDVEESILISIRQHAILNLYIIRIYHHHISLGSADQVESDEYIQ